MHRTESRPFRRLPALGLASALMLALGGPAHALEHGSYSMEILVGGVPLDELAGHGKTYVEALEGREYAIRLTNHTGRRVAMAVAVDGLNSIDAKTTSAGDASKWILGPFESITLDGWQTGSDTARRFFFTTEEQSYGAWLGKTANLGVITAAVFRERETRVFRPLNYGNPGRREDSERRSEPRSQAAPGKSHGAPPPRAGATEGQAQELSDDMAATGIGREVEHRVRTVRFDGEKDPITVLEVRYEYRDGLIALGIVPRHEAPLSRRERARGFADSGFAPDPFAHPHRR